MVENQYFTDHNCATFVIEKSQLHEGIQQGFSSLLGELINVGEVEVYNLYEQKLTLLNEALYSTDSKLSILSKGVSEYHQRIYFLPNRPQIVSEDLNKVVKPDLYSTDVLKTGSTVKSTPDKQVAAQPSVNPTITQDILAVPSGIIVQQVNCQGKMGAGLAAAIAQKWPEVKQEYLNKKDWQLAFVQFVHVSQPREPTLIVANVAGQYNYGTDKRQTDFEALKAGLTKVAQYAKENNLPVYIPDHLGSGLAGGRTLIEKDQTWARVKEIIVETIPDATIVSKPQEQGIAISGKPIPMNYPLMMHGETNPLPVDTCIDAMRGYGRTHTTRAYEPYKQYGFKEGDIAIAYSGASLRDATSSLLKRGGTPIAQGDDQQVAFRVGKQYQITQEMIADPAYQQQWALLEKHSAKALSELFTGKQQVWGLHMEPLGDCVDGKIVQFPEPLSTKTQQATTTTQKAVENDEAIP